MMGEPVQHQDVYDCDYCLRKFSKGEEYVEHLRIHDFELKHNCRHCGQSFPTRTDNRLHSAKCVQKLICKYCKVILESDKKKVFHEQQHHDEMFGKLCEKCGDKFSTKFGFDQHYKDQHKPRKKALKCAHCLRRFAYKTSLKSHMEKVHGTGQKYSCDQCGFGFKNKDSLRRHIINVHLRESRKIQCTVCNKLVSILGIRRHRNTHYSHLTKCPYCDMVSNDGSALEQHVKTHEKQIPELERVSCETCCKNFKTRHTLKKHIKLNHSGNFQCAHCDKVFKSLDRMKYHRVTAHEKLENPHKCHHCSKVFCNKSRLNDHLKIHSETRAYRCSLCGSTFRMKKHLTQHEKSKHDENRPIQCEQCSYTCKQYGSLIKHKKSKHTEVKKYSCNTCRKKFKTLNEQMCQTSKQICSGANAPLK